MEGTVRALFVTPASGATPLERSWVEATIGGFVGDHHSRPGRNRQILMISGSVLDELRLSPGSIFENVVVDGFDMMALKEGQRLAIGKAIVEVTIPCEPCSRMDRVRHGLKMALKDRRGMFAKVVEPGTIRIGETVREVPVAAVHGAVKQLESEL
jgi:MOSC domain-containing protein YiiM